MYKIVSSLHEKVFFIKILPFLFFLIFVIHAPLRAQENKNFTKDPIIVPENVKDTLGNTIKKTTKKDPQDNKTPIPTTNPPKLGKFDPKKEKKDFPIVYEDTLDIAEGTMGVIQISEELKIDCVWVKASEYYAIWDSKFINPYKKDPTKFKDTVQIQLYEPDKGHLWASPLEKILVTSNFGARWGMFHHGTDLNLKTGDPIFAAFDGIVRIAGFNAGGYGNYVVLRHYNGLETLYGHMSKLKSEVGQVIKAGQIIGLGGSTGRSTGPHLHFEVRYEGNSINPLVIYDFANTSNLIRFDKFTLKPYHFSHLGNYTRKIHYHTVKAGETLYNIAKRYGVTIYYVAKLNRITTKTPLKVGQKLRVK